MFSSSNSSYFNASTTTCLPIMFKFISGKAKLPVRIYLKLSMIRTCEKTRQDEKKERERIIEKIGNSRNILQISQPSASSPNVSTLVLLSCYVQRGRRGQRLNRVWPWSRTRAKLPEARRSVAVIPRKVRLFHPVEEMQQAYGGHTSLPARLVVNFVSPGSNVGAGFVAFLFPLPVYSTRLSGYDISLSLSLCLSLSPHSRATILSFPCTRAIVPRAFSSVVILRLRPAGCLALKCLPHDRKESFFFFQRTVSVRGPDYWEFRGNFVGLASWFWSLSGYSLTLRFAALYLSISTRTLSSYPAVNSNDVQKNVC